MAQTSLSFVYKAYFYRNAMKHRMLQALSSSKFTGSLMSGQVPNAFLLRPTCVHVLYLCIHIYIMSKTSTIYSGADKDMVM